MMLAPESPIGALAWERFPEREALVNEKFDEITRLTVSCWIGGIAQLPVTS